MKTDGRAMAGAILTGGLVAGGFDAVVSIGNHVAKGQGMLDVFRYIASGLIGMAAFRGGAWVEGLGILVHFGLATIMAAIFVLAARRDPRLLENPLLSGIGYGALVYAAMYYVIVPHSGAPHFKQPEGVWANLSAALGHGCFVGIPIVLAAQRWLGEHPLPAQAGMRQPLLDRVA